MDNVIDENNKRIARNKKALEFLKREAEKKAKANKKRTPLQFLKEFAGKGTSPVAKSREIETGGRIQKVGSSELVDVKSRRPIRQDNVITGYDRRTGEPIREDNVVVGYTTLRTEGEFLKETGDESQTRGSTALQYLKKFAGKRKSADITKPALTRVRKSTYQARTSKGSTVTGIYDKRDGKEFYGYAPVREGEKVIHTKEDAIKYGAGRYGGGLGMGTITESFNTKTSQIVDLAPAVSYSSNVLSSGVESYNAKVSGALFDDFGVLATISGKSAQLSTESKHPIDAQLWSGLSTASDYVRNKPLNVGAMVAGGYGFASLGAGSLVLNKIAVAGAGAYFGTRGYQYITAKGDYAKGQVLGKVAVEVGSFSLGASLGKPLNLNNVSLDKSSVKIKQFDNTLITDRGSIGGSIAGLKGTAYFKGSKIQIRGGGSYTVIKGGIIKSRITYDFFKGGLKVGSRTIQTKGLLTETFPHGNLGKLNVLSNKGVFLENIYFSTKTLTGGNLKTVYTGSNNYGLKSLGQFTQKNIIMPTPRSGTTSKLSIYKGSGSVKYGFKLVIPQNIKAETGFSFRIYKKGGTTSFIPFTSAPPVAPAKPIIIPVSSGIGGAVVGGSMLGLSAPSNIVNLSFGAGVLTPNKNILRGGIQPLNTNNYGYTSLNLTGGSSKNLAETGGLTKSLNKSTTGTISGGISSGVVMPSTSAIPMSEFNLKSSIIPQVTASAGSSYKVGTGARSSTSGFSGFTGGGITPPPPPPPIPPIFPGGLFLGTIKPGGKKGSKKGGFANLTGKYSPSLTAVLFNIKTTKTPRYTSGLAIQPIKIKL